MITDVPVVSPILSLFNAWWWWHIVSKYGICCRISVCLWHSWALSKQLRCYQTFSPPWSSSVISPVYTIQPVVKPVSQLVVLCNVYTNIQPVVKPVFDNRLYRVYSRLSKRLYNPVWQPVERTVAVRSTQLSNRFHNRLDVCLHDTASCQTDCTTGLTTGCIV